MAEVQKFRIREYQGQIVYRCDTLRQVEQWLFSRDMGLEKYYVEDVVDDIEVDADEVLEAWREGERYEDLQGF